MKPTLDQIEKISDFYNEFHGGFIASMRATLDYWESIRPADEPDRWIPLSERRPTSEDEDKNGQVFVISDSGYAIGIRRANMNPTNHSHWRRTNLPQPTAEEIEAKEIDAACDGVYSFDSFKAGWLAHKSKTAKLDIHQTTP